MFHLGILPEKAYVKTGVNPLNSNQPTNAQSTAATCLATDKPDLCAPATVAQSSVLVASPANHNRFASKLRSSFRDHALPGSADAYAPLVAGFSRQHTVQALHILLAYTETIAVDEISGWFDPAFRTQLIENLTQGPYPTQNSLIKEISTIDADADFEFGLDVLIRGLEIEFAKTATS